MVKSQATGSHLQRFLIQYIWREASQQASKCGAAATGLGTTLGETPVQNNNTNGERPWRLMVKEWEKKKFHKAAKEPETV